MNQTRKNANLSIIIVYAVEATEARNNVNPTRIIFAFVTSFRHNAELSKNIIVVYVHTQIRELLYVVPLVMYVYVVGMMVFVRQRSIFVFVGRMVHVYRLIMIVSA